MDHRTIENPVTGQRATFVETASDSGGARTVMDVETSPGGGVLSHRHGDHEELIEVIAGEIEVTAGGVARRHHAGETVVIHAGEIHSWRNPSADRMLMFRGTMTPGHPGFETVIRVSFGLGREGELRAGGLPRRFADLALLTDWDPSLLAVGARRVLAPLLRWSARRARANGRAAELLRRFGESDRAVH
jgi:quercetin dioxygenase-like cupin family protein